MYADTQDLLIHIPKWAAVLVLVLMYNPTHYYVLWALHRNNNTHCNGDISQYDGQTWSPFPRSQIHKHHLREPMGLPSRVIINLSQEVSYHADS